MHQSESINLDAGNSNYIPMQETIESASEQTGETLVTSETMCAETDNTTLMSSENIKASTQIIDSAQTQVAD